MSGTFGVKTAFGKSGQYDKIDGALVVSDAIHRVVMQVDEQGTVAAAATAVLMKRKRAPMLSVVADRTFVFVVVHRPSWQPLFVSIVDQPSNAE